MRRVNPRVLLGVGIPLLVIILLLAAWAIDSSRSSGKVPRNVSLAGREIGGMSEDKLALTVTDIAQEYENLPVHVRTSGDTFTTTTGKLGLRLNQDVTVSDALDINKKTNVFARPFVWLGSFASDRKADLTFTVDQQAMVAGIDALAGNAAPVEPKIVDGADGMAIISGKNGRSIDAEGVRKQLLARAESGETPIIVDAKLTEDAPKVADAVAQDFANRINAATTNGVLIVAGKHEVPIDATTLRSWLSGVIKDDKFVLAIDEAKANEAIKAAVPTDEEVQDAKFDVVNGAVQVTPGKNGEVCCGPDSATRVRDAIDKGENRVEVSIEVKKPKVSEEDITKLGIKEPVGSVTEWNGQPQVKSFTTYFQAGQPRGVNIHRIADMVRGTVILPGEQFSMNGVVGKRTREKGFVEAGAIANGKHVDEVGGGVSQFATTMFNAVYFAGLKIDTYQAHSEYFSRYPRGREATMGFPAPDLAWTNNSPHAILVWTSHTPTSVTVTLYSTQWATAEQTGSSESRSGSCTIVTTTRTIHYPDGKTGTDQFRARYRDPNKTTC